MKTQKVKVRTLDPPRPPKAPESPLSLLSYMDALVMKCQAVNWLEQEIDSGELCFLVHRGGPGEDQDRAGWIRSVCRDALEAELAKLRALAGEAMDQLKEGTQAA
jgi:hypothetical protein